MTFGENCRIKLVNSFELFLLILRYTELVFFLFNKRPLSSNQLLQMITHQNIIADALSSDSLQSFPVTKTETLSANQFMWPSSVDKLRSLMYTRNNIGGRIEPCGILTLRRGHRAQQTLSIHFDTHHLENSQSNRVELLVYHGLVKRMEWFTQSKALDKSQKIPNILCDSSRGHKFDLWNRTLQILWICLFEKHVGLLLISFYENYGIMKVTFEACQYNLFIHFRESGYKSKGLNYCLKL